MLSEWKEEKELARNREWGGGPRQREKHVQMPRGGSDSPSNIVGDCGQQTSEGLSGPYPPGMERPWGS